MIIPKNNLNVNTVKRNLSIKKAIGYYTDQLVEAMHQHTDRVLSKSNYHVKDITSDIHGEKVLHGINHLNSYNL